VEVYSLQEELQMPLNKLLALDPTRTLKWLEDPAGSQFSELIREWFEEDMRKLKSSIEDYEVFRAQGSIKRLTQILGIHQEIKEYLHDVSLGKRKPIDKKELEGGSHGVAR
jgi:ABC-type uncharacterized transport system ATPase subunit